MNDLACILYHDNCTDGTAAAWVTAEYLRTHGFAENEIHFLPMDYKQRDPGLLKNMDIYVVDFSLEISVIERLLDAGCSIVILDHHKSAADMYKKYVRDYVGDNYQSLEKPYEPQDSVILRTERISLFCDAPEEEYEKAPEYSGMCKIVIDQKYSGASLAWRYFNKSTPPAIIDYVQDRDLWTKKFPETDSVIWLTRIMKLNRNNFGSVSAMPKSEVVEKGAVAKQTIDFVAEQCAANMSSYFVVGSDWMLRKFVATNAPHVLSSETCQIMLEKLKTVELSEELSRNLVCTFQYEGDKVRLSFRSTDKSAKIVAEALGGGGHDNAAGVVLDKAKFEFLGGL